MRNAFSTALLSQAKRNRTIVLLTGDLGYTVFEEFAETFPDRFINAGVAEANMMGVACGMAHTGLIPIVYSIATFATMRGFEQIRDDVCVHNANVKIIGTGAGLSYGHAGTTHHALEDIAIMRALPHMTVVCPSDKRQAYALTKSVIEHKGPVYFRLGKRGEPDIYDKPQTWIIGKATIVYEGNDAAIVATGNMIYTAVCASNLLRKKGIRVAVVDMHTVKPIDRACIVQLAKRVKVMITLEEHSIIGGLGSAVAEILAEIDSRSVRLLRLGIPDTFVDVIGSQEHLRRAYFLTPKDIAKKIQKYA